MPYDDHPNKNQHWLNNTINRSYATTAMANQYCTKMPPASMGMLPPAYKNCQFPTNSSSDNSTATPDKYHQIHQLTRAEQIQYQNYANGNETQVKENLLNITQKGEATADNLFLPYFFYYAFLKFIKIVCDEKKNQHK